MPKEHGNAVPDPNDSNEGIDVNKKQNEKSLFENMEQACQEIRRQSLNMLLKMTQTMNESEKIDGYYETRLDDLIKEACELEKVLLNQKQSIKEKVKNLTMTLALSPDL